MIFVSTFVQTKVNIQPIDLKALWTNNGAAKSNNIISTFFRRVEKMAKYIIWY